MFANETKIFRWMIADFKTISLGESQPLFNYSVWIGELGIFSHHYTIFFNICYDEARRRKLSFNVVKVYG